MLRWNNNSADVSGNVKTSAGCRKRKWQRVNKRKRKISMNVFDILGPVMIGPSSSHTAGAARIGLVTRALLGKTPVKAHIFLHGSFAKTYKGHGTDKALVAGILGMQTDDERIRFSLDVAKKEGLEIQIETGELENTHPNTAEITLTAADGEKVSLRGSSIGGGNILITRVNGMEVALTLYKLKGVFLNGVL